MNLRMEPGRVGATGRDLTEMVDDAKSRLNSRFGPGDARRRQQGLEVVDVARRKA
jgi:hypothetical protein